MSRESPIVIDDSDSEALVDRYEPNPYHADRPAHSALDDMFGLGAAVEQNVYFNQPFDDALDQIERMQVTNVSSMLEVNVKLSTLAKNVLKQRANDVHYYELLQFVEEHGLSPIACQLGEERRRQRHRIRAIRAIKTRQTACDSESSSEATRAGGSSPPKSASTASNNKKVDVREATHRAKQVQQAARRCVHALAPKSSPKILDPNIQYEPKAKEAANACEEVAKIYARRMMPNAARIARRRSAFTTV